MALHYYYHACNMYNIQSRTAFLRNAKKVMHVFITHTHTHTHTHTTICLVYLLFLLFCKKLQNSVHSCLNDDTLLLTNKEVSRHVRATIAVN